MQRSCHSQQVAFHSHPSYHLAYYHCLKQGLLYSLLATNLLCGREWPWISDLLLATPWMLRLQMWITIPCLGDAGIEPRGSMYTRQELYYRSYNLKGYFKTIWIIASHNIHEIKYVHLSSHALEATIATFLVNMVLISHAYSSTSILSLYLLFIKQ